MKWFWRVRRKGRESVRLDEQRAQYEADMREYYAHLRAGHPLKQDVEACRAVALMDSWPWALTAEDRSFLRTMRISRDVA